MARIQTVNKETADADTQQLLGNIEKKMGKIPNILGAMANSTATANAYLGFSQALSGGSLSARLREQIALVVGETNGCDYCLAAHTALGQRAGLTPSETVDARRAESADVKEQAALAFAHRIVAERGVVDDADLQAVRQVGFTDGEVTEIIANVALNIFTNYFNHIAETEIDFPIPPALTTA